LRAHEIDIWSDIRPGILLTEEEQAAKREAKESMTMLDRILYVPKSFFTSLIL